MYVTRHSDVISVLIPRQTAALGLFNGLKIPLPDLDSLPEESLEDEDEAEPESKDTTVEKHTDDSAPRLVDDTPQTPPHTRTIPKKGDWVVVLGGASSVGKYAIQVGTKPPSTALNQLCNPTQVLILPFSLPKQPATTSPHPAPPILPRYGPHLNHRSPHPDRPTRWSES